jgi:thiamine-phosphate pyrophosphorylase
MRDLRRMLDANEDRAREALRVLEDLARFTLDHRELSAALKRIRHGLAQAIARVPGGRLALVANRDAAGDVGATVTTANERTRTGTRDLAAASGKRLGEALRAIEEALKGLALPDAAAEVERLRYAAYDAERTLTLALGAADAPQWRLCVVLSAALCPDDDWRRVARAALDAGADCLQLREKALDGGALLDRVRELRDMTADADAALIVNDRPDIALLAHADGVHLGQTDLPVEAVRALAGDRLLVGVSTTSIEQARAALHAGADYCGVGPMFPTATKHTPGGRTDGTVAGVAYLRDYVAHEPDLPPHLAIGGVTAERTRELAAAGCRGVAVSAAICAADDPHAATRAILDALNSDA